jgi:uncharacterized protein DUF4340
MRGGKSFLILVILALGIGGYAYFVESKREPAGTAAKKPGVFTVDTEKIEEVEIKSASGDTTSLKKNGAKWEITAPQKLDVDDTEISSVLSTLRTLEVQRTIDENPKSLAGFGLEPPRITVGFRAAGESGMHRLQVGNKTPTGGDLYARVEGQPKLFLISSYLEDSLNKNMFALRDKTLLKFAREDVDSLTIEPASGTALAFAKKGNDWRFTKPFDAKADVSATDGIIGRLAQTRMKSVAAADGTAELKKYGLDKPDVVATVGAGSTRATLAVGGKADDTSVYARDLSRPMVFTVDKTLVDDLKKKPEDLRKKDLFDFRSFSAAGLDVTTGGQTYTFGKEKAGGKEQSSAVDQWKLQKPAPKDVDQTKMTDLLTTLSNLRADTFAEKPLAAGDTIEITARFGDAAAPQTEKVTFRKSGSTVHAMLPGEGGAAVVPTADFDKVLALIKDVTGTK